MVLSSYAPVPDHIARQIGRSIHSRSPVADRQRVAYVGGRVEARIGRIAPRQLDHVAHLRRVVIGVRVTGECPAERAFGLGAMPRRVEHDRAVLRLESGDVRLVRRIVGNIEPEALRRRPVRREALTVHGAHPPPVAPVVRGKSVAARGGHGRLRDAVGGHLVTGRDVAEQVRAGAPGGPVVIRIKLDLVVQQVRRLVSIGACGPDKGRARAADHGIAGRCRQRCWRQRLRVLGGVEARQDRRDEFIGPIRSRLTVEDLHAPVVGHAPLQSTGRYLRLGHSSSQLPRVGNGAAIPLRIVEVGVIVNLHTIEQAAHRVARVLIEPVRPVEQRREGVDVAGRRELTHRRAVPLRSMVRVHVEGRYHLERIGRRLVGPRRRFAAVVKRAHSVEVGCLVQQRRRGRNVHIRLARVARQRHEARGDELVRRDLYLIAERGRCIGGVRIARRRPTDPRRRGIHDRQVRRIVGVRGGRRVVGRRRGKAVGGRLRGVVDRRPVVVLRRDTRLRIASRQAVNVLGREVELVVTIADLVEARVEGVRGCIEDLTVGVAAIVEILITRGNVHQRVEVGIGGHRRHLELQP